MYDWPIFNKFGDNFSKIIDLITSDTKRILIIRLSSLGDILLTTPLVRSIKKQFQSITIDYLTTGNFSDTLKYNPYISNLYNFDKGGTNTELYFKLLKNNYDLIVDLHNNFRTKAITKKLNVPSARFKKPGVKKFLLVNLKWNLIQNEVQIPLRYARTLPSVKLDHDGLDFLFESSSNLPETDERLIGFCPGSKHFTKMWPVEYFAELGKLLINNGYKIVLLGGNDDKLLCERLSNEIKGSVNRCNENNLFATAKELTACTAVICNDSGLMHLASALKKPVITIFGSSVREFGFTPYKTKNLVLENNSLSCRPCSHIGRKECPKGHFKCMMEITPQTVYNNLTEFSK